MGLALFVLPGQQQALCLAAYRKRRLDHGSMGEHGSRRVRSLLRSDLRLLTRTQSYQQEARQEQGAALRHRGLVCAVGATVSTAPSRLPRELLSVSRSEA